jgi:hypothetical protein
VSLDGLDDLVDAFPVVGVFGLSIDDLEALEYVDDVVDASAFDGELARALVQVQQRLALPAVQPQEPSAQLPQTLLLPTVRELRLQRPSRVVFVVSELEEASLGIGGLQGARVVVTGV